MAGIDDTFDKYLNTDPPPPKPATPPAGAKASPQGTFPPVGDATKDVAKAKELWKFMGAMNQSYSDPNSIFAERNDPPETAIATWTQIAEQIVNKYVNDRGAKAYPASNGAKRFQVGIAPLGIGTTGTGVLLPKNEDKFRKDAVQKIIKWFQKNWDDAVEKGGGPAKPDNSEAEEGDTPSKLAPLPAGKIDNGSPPSAPVASTVPDNKTQSKAVADQFNKFYVGGIFGIGGGVPLPSFLKESSDLNQSYVNYCAPHKNAQGNETNNITGAKKGAFGFCMGPFIRNVIIKPVEGKTVKIKDGNKEYKDVQMFEEVLAPKDENRIVLFSELYANVIKSKCSNYASFFKDNDSGSFTGEPIDGKEIKIPIYSDPPEENSNGDLVPEREISINPKVYNPGLDSGNRIGRGPLFNRPFTNENFGEPIDDPSYGSAVMSEFPLKEGSINLWKYNNGNRVLVGPKWSDAWGGTDRNPTGAQAKVEFRPGTKRKEDAPRDAQKKIYSYSDPRTWGPWEEYTTIDSRVNKEDIPNNKIGYAYKYIVPGDGFGNSKSAPLSDFSINGPGIPAVNGPGYVTMNKQYWGFRLREAFPDAESTAKARGQAINPPAVKTDKSVVVPGTAGFQDAAIFVAGPAPPCNIKVTSKASAFKFEFNNAKVLDKKGDVTRSDGKTFTRDAANSMANLKRAKIFVKHWLTLKKNDTKPKISASGGMVWRDPAKQIITPYAPPPALKPPLPNTKTVKTTGVK